MYPGLALEKLTIQSRCAALRSVLDLELHFLDAGQNLCHIQTTSHAPQTRGTIDKPHSYRVPNFGDPNLPQALLRIFNNHQPLQQGLCERYC